MQYTGESMNVDGMVALLNYRVRSPLPSLVRFVDVVSESIVLPGGWHYS